MGAEVDGQDRLGGLAHAVSAALNNGAYVDDDAVYRQGVCPQAGHDLPVEQHGEQAHGDVDEKGGKARRHDLPQLARKPCGPHKAQRVLF